MLSQELNLFVNSSFLSKFLQKSHHTPPVFTFTHAYSCTQCSQLVLLCFVACKNNQIMHKRGIHRKPLVGGRLLKFCLEMLSLGSRFVCLRQPVARTVPPPPGEFTCSCLIRCLTSRRSRTYHTPRLMRVGAASPASFCLDLTAECLTGRPSCLLVWAWRGGHLTLKC